MKEPAFSGYTILEVMLFIVISASMLMLAITSFSGRQQDVQFSQSVRDFDAKLQDTINDVSTGFYPNGGLVSCIVNAVNARPILDNATTNPVKQGTNDDCVFIGKAVQFSPDDGDATTDNNSIIYTYNIVGRRYKTGEDLSESLEDSKPVAVAASTPASSIPDTTDKADLKFGLRVTRVAITGTPVTDIGVIGFFSSFNRSVGTAVFSESQTVKSAAIPSTRLDEFPFRAVSRINRITDKNPPTGSDVTVDTSSTRPIIVCLADDTGRRRASITIGGEGRASTKVDIDTYDQGVCG